MDVVPGRDVKRDNFSRSISRINDKMNSPFRSNQEIVRSVKESSIAAIKDIISINVQRVDSIVYIWQIPSSSRRWARAILRHLFESAIWRGQMRVDLQA